MVDWKKTRAGGQGNVQLQNDAARGFLENQSMVGCAHFDKVERSRDFNRLREVRRVDGEKVDIGHRPVLDPSVEFFDDRNTLEGQDGHARGRSGRREAMGQVHLLGPARGQPESPPAIRVAIARCQRSSP